MRGTRAKKLRNEARKRGKDGSVIISKEYKRLKKLHTNPHYSKNIKRGSQKLKFKSIYKAKP